MKYQFGSRTLIYKLYQDHINQHMQHLSQGGIGCSLLFFFDGLSIYSISKRGANFYFGSFCYCCFSLSVSFSSASLLCSISVVILVSVVILSDLDITDSLNSFDYSACSRIGSLYSTLFPSALLSLSFYASTGMPSSFDFDFTNFSTISIISTSFISFSPSSSDLISNLLLISGTDLSDDELLDSFLLTAYYLIYQYELLFDLTAEIGSADQYSLRGLTLISSACSSSYSAGLVRRFIFYSEDSLFLSLSIGYYQQHCIKQCDNQIEIKQQF